MTPEELRIEVAKAVGPRILCCTQPGDKWLWSNGNGYWRPCADNDPLADLNAMHEAEKVLTKRADRVEYTGWLNTLVGHKFSWEATAAQRAEAFLKCLNLWTP